MSMSLDGFIAGPNQSVENGLGAGGDRLHEWIFRDGALPDAVDGITPHVEGANKVVMDELMSTGAVVTARGTFEAAGAWGGDHHDRVPIYVIQRSEPDPAWADLPLVTYTPDIADAVRSAKEAAGEKNVMMHGATATRLALEAGVLDELEIHLVPVLLGGGTRLFDDLVPRHIELERTRVLEGDSGLVHLHYRVVH